MTKPHQDAEPFFITEEVAAEMIAGGYEFEPPPIPCTIRPFDLPAVSFTAEVSESVLAGQGLAWHRMDSGADSALVCSTPERAMLELCDGVSDAALVYEADALMQAMTTLRPQRIGLMLRHCRSIKAKRLFLALAERHKHAWLSHVPLDGVELGRGKRALVPGGRLHPTYQITLPGDLDEHLA